jgi:glycine oxidase
LGQSVIIVGAGIVGCAIARELTVRGVSCTIIDERQPAGGSTQASAGMLAPYVEAHEPGPLLDFGVRSLQLYDDWIAAVRRESGIDVEYRRIGTLQVATEPKRAAELTAAATNLPDVLRWMSREEVTNTHAAIGANAGALFTATHGYVAAAQLTAALVSAAQHHGAVLQNAHVNRIEPSGDSVRVTTSAGTLSGDRVVLAAGAWANAIEGVAAPPVRPVRGQLLHLGWGDRGLSTIVWGPQCYCVPRLDGSLLVGATMEEVGFDERNTAGAVRGLLEAVCALLPAAREATFIRARAGLRPATTDGLPAIGPDARHPQIVHASGHFRNGVLLAPITAKAIGDWIVDGKRDAMFDAFAPNRFNKEN